MSVLAAVATWRLPVEAGERSLDGWSPLLLALACCAVLFQARWPSAGGVATLLVLVIFAVLVALAAGDHGRGTRRPSLLHR